MEFRSYINVLGPFSLFSPILITCGVASSRRRQISPVWTGFPVRSRPDWGTSLLSSNSLLVLLVALCWVLGEVGQVLPVPVRILGAAPSSSQPNECFQLRAPCTTPPPNLPVPEGTTLCPQLTTRESAWLCVFEQKVDRREGFGKLSSGLRAACVFYDGHLSIRQNLQLHLIHVGVKAPVKDDSNSTFSPGS